MSRVSSAQLLTVNTVMGDKESATTSRSAFVAEGEGIIFFISNCY
jgi:hypothetical protein